MNITPKRDPGARSRPRRKGRKLPAWSAALPRFGVRAPAGTGNREHKCEPKPKSVTYVLTAPKPPGSPLISTQSRHKLS
jgi:hypothetical protein